MTSIFLRKVILFLGIIIIINTCGCSYFEVYKKTNYVSDVTTVIKKQQDEVDNYISLTADTSGKMSRDEIKKAFVMSKDKLGQYKKDLEAITPPEDYKDEHQDFVNGFQMAIEAVDTSIALTDIKDEKEKSKKIEETKSKIAEYRKVIKIAINRIMVDLR